VIGRLIYKTYIEYKRLRFFVLVYSTYEITIYAQLFRIYTAFSFPSPPIWFISDM